MDSLASQFNLLFERFRKAQEMQPIHEKIHRLLCELKPLIEVQSIYKKVELSENTLNTFLANFADANEVGKTQRSENPPDLVFWNALGFGKDEVTNCRILCWLLDPSADHCQGNRFFACLLQLECLKQFANYAQHRIYVSREEWLDETNRADIIIHGNEFNIVIEAKIKAPERENQRVDYRERMTKNYPDGKIKFIGIFLTSKNNHKEEAGWISITWQDICATINRFSSFNNEYSCNNSFVSELAKQYGKYIIQEIIQ